MEKEIEVKVIGLSEKELSPVILKSGGKFDIEEHQINYHIDSSSHPIENKSYMRLRVTEINGNVVSKELTYKEQINTDSARVNNEYTVNIDDEKMMLLVLSKLGYDEVHIGTKIRRRYLYKDYKFEFDEWDKETLSFPYLEIESPSEKALNEVLKEFNIPKEMITTKSIAELQIEDKKNG